MAKIPFHMGGQVQHQVAAAPKRSTDFGTEPYKQIGQIAGAVDSVAKAYKQFDDKRMRQNSTVLGIELDNSYKEEDLAVQERKAQAIEQNQEWTQEQSLAVREEYRAQRAELMTGAQVSATDLKQYELKSEGLDTVRVKQDNIRQVQEEIERNNTIILTTANGMLREGEFDAYKQFIADNAFALGEPEAAMLIDQAEETYNKVTVSSFSLKADTIRDQAINGDIDGLTARAGLDALVGQIEADENLTDSAKSSAVNKINGMRPQINSKMRKDAVDLSYNLQGQAADGVNTLPILHQNEPLIKEALGDSYFKILENSLTIPLMGDPKEHIKKMKRSDDAQRNEIAKRTMAAVFDPFRKNKKESKKLLADIEKSTIPAAEKLLMANMIVKDDATSEVDTKLFVAAEKYAMDTGDETIYEDTLDSMMEIDELDKQIRNSWFRYIGSTVGGTPNIGGAISLYKNWTDAKREREKLVDDTLDGISQKRATSTALQSIIGGKSSILGAGASINFETGE